MDAIWGPTLWDWKRLWPESSKLDLRSAAPVRTAAPGCPTGSCPSLLLQIPLQHPGAFSLEPAAYSTPSHFLEHTARRVTQEELGIEFHVNALEGPRGM
jgi:hypothetical protein